MGHSLVQIFGVSDARVRDVIINLLSEVPQVEVAEASSRLGLLVSTACIDVAQAESVFRLVKSIDFDAVLVYSSDDPVEPLAA